jgi:hypothetical protein
MASEKQIAANRANAMRSTGPKTSAGKRKSSRNAYRHGLSGEVPQDSATSAKVEAIARELAGEQASKGHLTSAASFVRAQLELIRIRSIRAEQLAKIDLSDRKSGTMRELQRLVALDRYERYAHTHRRRASQKLRPEG